MEQQVRCWHSDRLRYRTRCQSPGLTQRATRGESTGRGVPLVGGEPVQPHCLDVVLRDPRAIVIHQSEVTLRRRRRVPTGPLCNQLLEPREHGPRPSGTRTERALRGSAARRAVLDPAHLCWHVALAAVLLATLEALAGPAVIVDQADRARVLRFFGIVFTTGTPWAGTTAVTAGTAAVVPPRGDADGGPDAAALSGFGAGLQ